MDLKETLMVLEQQFWEASSAADVELIRGYLTDDALVTGSFGVLDKETTIAGAEGQSPFVFWRIEDEPQLLQLTENSAVIIYKASAQREGCDPFTVQMSSTYVNLNGAWKLAFHHQTPLPKG